MQENLKSNQKHDVEKSELDANKEVVMNNISSLKKKNDEFNMRIMSMLNEIKTNVSIMVVKVNFVIF